MKVQLDPRDIPPWRRPKYLEQPIKALRGWRLAFLSEEDSIERGWILLSISAFSYWTGPVLRASFKPFDTELWDKARKAAMDAGTNMPRGYPYTRLASIPGVAESLTAGIYAVKEGVGFQYMLGSYYPDVTGEVDLWGRVAQFQYGYRAELCMIRSLNICATREKLKSISQNKQIVSDLETRYQCPVTMKVRNKHSL